MARTQAPSFSPCLGQRYSGTQPALPSHPKLSCKSESYQELHF